MTYLGFHLVFNLPLLLVLWFWPGRAPLALEHTVAMAIVLGIVMVFTTPWDNYAVAKGIWNFPQERILFRIGWLPVEEYVFFIVQSIQAMLMVHVLQPLLPGGWRAAIAWTAPEFFVPVALLAVAMWALGRCPAGRFSNGTRFHYAFHLLYWFLPIVALQWFLAWPLLSANWELVVIVTLSIGVYLTLADIVAVRYGIWFFDERQITGHKLGGVLPWEEAAFFQITSLLVVQSYLLLLPPRTFS